MCGKNPKHFYDNDKYDAFYNIKCCNIHVRNYRTIAFIEWNKTMKKYERVKNYFETHHGEVIDAGDISQIFDIDIEEAIKLCARLETNGEIKEI